MKCSIFLTFMVALIAAGTADAVRRESCSEVPASILSIDGNELILRGIDVSGLQFDATLAQSHGFPNNYTVRGVTRTLNPGVAGSIYNPTSGSIHSKCVEYNGFMFWANMDLVSIVPDLTYGLKNADLVRDLSGSTLSVPLVTGTSQLKFGSTGKVTLDNTFTGTWEQTGNDIDVSVEDGSTNFMLSTSSGGISGIANHFGQKTELSGVHPIDTTIALGNKRFQVSLCWRNFSMNPFSDAYPVYNGDDSALFWFLDENNTELLVKVLDSCETKNRFWVYAAASTDVEFTLTVTDTQTNEVKTYSNPLGQSFTAITDTSAFATCP